MLRQVFLFCEAKTSIQLASSSSFGVKRKCANSFITNDQENVLVRTQLIDWLVLGLHVQ